MKNMLKEGMDINARAEGCTSMLLGVRGPQWLVWRPLGGGVVRSVRDAHDNAVHNPGRWRRGVGWKDHTGVDAPAHRVLGLLQAAVRPRHCRAGSY